MLITMGKKQYIEKGIPKRRFRILGSRQKMLESTVGIHKNNFPSNKAYPIDNINRGRMVRKSKLLSPHSKVIKEIIFAYFYIVAFTFRHPAISFLSNYLEKTQRTSPPCFFHFLATKEAC